MATQNTLRKIHKWIFLYFGVFMFLWVTTGLIISTPLTWFENEPGEAEASIDYANISSSPADVIRKLNADKSTVIQVKDMHIRKIQGRTVYAVVDNNWKTRLIDTATGELVSITPSMAEAIARKKYNINASLLDSTSLERHTASYPWGELPIYRLHFSNAPSTVYYVSPASGDITRSSLLTRIRNAAGFLHDFGPVEMLTHSNTLKKAALVTIAAISLAGVFAGLYLLLPLRRQTR